MPASAPSPDRPVSYTHLRWVLLGQINIDAVQFLDCSTDAQHPKSARLRAAVLRLLELSGQYADSVLSPLPPIAANPASGCCKKGGIDCCNTGTIPSDASVPYLVFNGCPDEVRSVCGRLLIGPFRLSSNSNPVSYTHLDVYTRQP